MRQTRFSRQCRAWTVSRLSYLSETRNARTISTSRAGPGTTIERLRWELLVVCLLHSDLRPKPQSVSKGGPIGPPLGPPFFCIR
jgi:hypothetical protein